MLIKQGGWIHSPFICNALRQIISILYHAHDPINQLVKINQNHVITYLYCCIYDEPHFFYSTSTYDGVYSSINDMIIWNPPNLITTVHSSLIGSEEATICLCIYNGTCYEQPLLWAASLLWEATLAFPKMAFCIQMDLLCFCWNVLCSVKRLLTCINNINVVFFSSYFLIQYFISCV